MEALSPRDANANIRVNHAVRRDLKPITAPVKPTQREKDHPPPPPPEVFEPASFDQKDGVVYKTGRLLGRGGFAICYEGQNTTSRQIFALKIVKSHMPQKKLEQKFQTELQIHSKMKHANIVEFYRAFSYQNCTYIVLELCPNGSLMDVVKKRKFVTEPEVRFWIVQMAGAVKYMHGKGIIHRDLKMGNIFLDKNMNVKIGDFGLAALLMSGKDWQACRRTTLCGTPNYIAPEILAKDKAGHNHAVDIWSLGIITFALLTGKPPFQSETSVEIYRRARERDYDWPTLDTSKNLISEEIKDLVSELLQAPQERPDPDKIVQHPFFTCGWTPRPEEMTTTLRERHPDPTHSLSISDQEINLKESYKNLKKLCIKCEVGPWSTSRKYTSTYCEVAEEEKLGLTPAVPLANDVVYRPFRSWLEEQVKNIKENGENKAKALQVLKDIASPMSKKQIRNISSNRPPAQSFAAQQRAKSQSSYVHTRLGHENRPPTCFGIINSKSNSSLQKFDHKIRESVTDVDGLAIKISKNLHLNGSSKNHQEHNSSKKSVISPVSIFDETENIKLVPNTKPESVLSRLHRLQVELERALNSRSIAADTPTPKRSPVIVVKWVDYTNKFGLGYILSNGSVGTIFRAIPASHQDPSKGLTPPTYVIIRASEKHLINQNNPNWVDFGQLVPMSKHKIEFFENRGEHGIFCVEVDPGNFRSIPGPNGEMFKLGAGKNEFDSRKKERVALWRKFGNYMTQYGRDAEYPGDDNINNCSDFDSSTRHFVTFYQRWGDVGCWCFEDGHLQFNFPDHTKIILSADGTWCDFYYLTLTAARNLAEKGILPVQALDERQHLSYPLQTMLNFTLRNSRSKSHLQTIIDPSIQGIPQANDLRRKIEFIVLCIKEWTTNGGIGKSDLSVKGRLRWSGARQSVDTKIPYKQVWVSVGGQSTDERKVMWFDPRTPEIISPDIST